MDRVGVSIRIIIFFVVWGRRGLFANLIEFGMQLVNLITIAHSHCLLRISQIARFPAVCVTSEDTTTVISMACLMSYRP